MIDSHSTVLYLTILLFFRNHLDMESDYWQGNSRSSQLMLMMHEARWDKTREGQYKVDHLKKAVTRMALQVDDGPAAKEAC